MFATIDIKKSDVTVVFNKHTSSETEFKRYLCLLRNVYRTAPKFQLTFDARFIHTSNLKYLKRHAQFMRTIETLTKTQVSRVEIVVNSFVVKKLIQGILLFKPPVVPCSIVNR